MAKGILRSPRQYLLKANMWILAHFVLNLLCFLPADAALHYDSSCLPDSIQRGVLIEIWSGLTRGDDISELESLPSYPHQPEVQKNQANLDFQENLKSKSGVRSRAYFVCSMSGSHVFSIKCDDWCRFTVKVDGDYSENLLYYDALYYPSYQDVSPLNLTGGKLYFLEVVSIQKEDGGYFGVGVTIPSGVVVRPVTKDHLAMYIPDSIKPTDCPSEALGMESRAIADRQISASTEYHKVRAAAIQGRLHFQASLEKIGAWAAAKSNTNQWLQIDLIGPFIRVTRVATQGRNSLVSGVGKQWVKRYKLQFSNDVASFQFYKEQGQNEAKEFAGNSDRDTVVFQDLNPPITARYIRFLPVAWNGWISMRVELYGCQVIPQRTFAKPGSWGDWTDCSVTCGDGLRSRTRTTCTDPPTGLFHGLDTSSSLTEKLNCTMGPCPECLPGWIHFMGSCYMLQPHSANWDSAVRKCLDLNSKLVDIKSQQENDFLAKHMTDRGCKSSWIGLSDLDIEDVFVWTDGVHANFTSWGGSESNGGERENCVRLDSNSKWVDNECSRGLRFICEKRAHDDEAQCIDNPIGMESERIPDHAITFSNTKDGYGSQALGRLGIPSSAWCGKQTGSGHMQINLQHIYYILAVATQGGRYPDDYYLVSYNLELSADGIVWDYYQEHSLNKIFEGNSNPYTVMKNNLTRGVVASHIRFSYDSSHFYNDYPCIRVEIYGHRQVEPKAPTRALRISNIWFYKRNSLSATWFPLFAYFTYGIIQGYTVQYYEADGNTQEAKTQKTATTYILIEGLKAYTNYCISVSAINEYGVGKNSDPECLLTDEGVPVVPPNITAYSTSSTSLRVDWAPLPPDVVPGYLTGYRVKYRQSSNAFTGDVFVSAGELNTWEYRGLLAYTQYCVQVLGETKYGSGPEYYDECVNVTTAEEGAPGSTPGNITAYNTSSTSLEITWQAVPREFANGHILGYRISYRKAEEFNSTRIDLCSEMFSFALSNLTVFTNYCIQMSAFTRKGMGNNSDCVFCSTDEEAPGQPPANLSAYNTSSTSIKVTWDPVPVQFRREIILGYRVYLTRSTQHGPGRRKRSSPGTGNEIYSETTNLTTEFQGLEKYSNYCVEAVAYNRIGESDKTNIICTLTDEAVPSEAPANFAGHNTSATSLVIEWSSIPQEFIHGILLGYKIFYRRTSEPNVPYQTLPVPPEELRKELTELLKYTEYCTKVAGYTRRGDGKSTECLNITTAQDKPSSAPHPVTASSYESPHKITLSWAALLQSEINGKLIGYKVEYKMIGVGGGPVTDSETLTELVPPNVISFVLINQSVFTSFKFKVAAVTEAGVGDFSEEVVGETCRCEKRFSTALKPSALDKDGALIKIITDVIEESCGECQEHGKTQLVTVKSSEQDDNEPELSFPVTVGSVRGSQFSKYLAVIQVPKMLVIKRREQIPGVYQKVVTSSVFDNWPIFVFAFVTMMLAGIIIWILDSQSNQDNFPRSFVKGVAEGFWWSFITMTTVGYGDRFPKGLLAKVFAIVWFLVGLIIYTFFGAAVTALMTVTIITESPTLRHTKNKVSAVSNSTEFNLAVKTLSGKWEIGKHYETTEELVNALKSSETDAIFVDMYLPTKRPEWFNGTWFEVDQFVEADMSYGIVLRGEAMKLHKALKDFIDQNNVQSKYLSSGDENTVSAPVHSHDTTFFEVNSPYYVVTIISVVSMLCCAVVCGLTYDILRRRKEKKHDGLSTRDKDALSNELHEVVKAFRDSFSTKFAAMKRKHKRQLKVLNKTRGTVITTRL